MSLDTGKVCYRFRVIGKVQGVFFRASTRDQAKSLGLSGWVRNLHSGEVELLACGDKEKIEMLERWLWQGPQYANVSAVKMELFPGTIADIEDGFTVRRDG